MTLPPQTTASPGSHAGQRLAAWQAARRVLVVRLDNLGDLLMTTPAIAAIAAGRRAGEAAVGGGRRHITLLTSRAGAALLPHLPTVDEALVYDAPWVQGPSRSGHGDRRFLAKLARWRFEAAVIFTVSTQSALPAAMLCRMAGIPLRLAYSRENPYDLLTDCIRDREVIGDGMQHEVQRQVALVRSVGFETPEADGPPPRLDFSCRPIDIEGARSQLRRVGGDPSAPYLVIHPGSSAASRRYPAERFGQAAGLIAAAAPHLQVVYAGGPGEAAAVAEAQAAQAAIRPPAGGGAGSISLAGALSLGELGALIAGAELVVCNNSGPAHLAAATGTPLVVLYALTNPQHTPWQVPSRVLNQDVPCRNCQKSICPEGHHRCLLGVTPGAVAAAALSLLDETAPGGRRPRTVAVAASARPAASAASAP